MFGREFTESGIALQFCKKKIDILESISVVSAVAGLGPGERPCKISENFSWVIITNSIIRRLLNLKLL